MNPDATGFRTNAGISRIDAVHRQVMLENVFFRGSSLRRRASARGPCVRGLYRSELLFGFVAGVGRSRSGVRGRLASKTCRRQLRLCQGARVKLDLSRRWPSARFECCRLLPLGSHARLTRDRLPRASPTFVHLATGSAARHTARGPCPRTSRTDEIVSRPSKRKPGLRTRLSYRSILEARQVTAACARASGSTPRSACGIRTALRRSPTARAAGCRRPRPSSADRTPSS